MEEEHRSSPSQRESQRALRHRMSAQPESRFGEEGEGRRLAAAKRDRIALARTPDDP
jgi:hypothetical protein